MKTTYQIDSAHSGAQFSVRHMMITNVRGAFAGLQGTVTCDPESRTIAGVEATIDATTLNTQNAERDGHVKGPDFLDVAKYPTMTFKSKSVAAAGKGGAVIKGDLTLHGVTKEVALKVQGPTAEGKDPWGHIRVGVSATAQLKRSDFGLSWNAALETGGVLISDEVGVALEVSLIKA